jgi:hypothetical protein
MTRQAARASSLRRRRPRTLCVRCGVCVDARDARGLLYVSAVKRRRVAVLHVRPLRHLLLFAVALSLLLCAERVFARAWRRRRRVVTGASVALAVSLACVVG